MRTRKAVTPPTKKQPVRKCTTKSPFNSSGSASGTPVTPSAAKRAAAARPKRAKKDEEASPAIAAASPVADSKPEVPSGEDTEGSPDMQVTPARQVVAFTRSAAKRATEKNKTLAPDKSLSNLELVSGASVVTIVEDCKEKPVLAIKDAEIIPSDRLLSEQDPASGNTLNSRIEDSKQKKVTIVEDVEIISSDSLLSEQGPEFGDSMKQGIEEFKKEAEVGVKDVEIIASNTFLSQGVCAYEGSMKSIIEEAREKESLDIKNREMIEEDTIMDEVGECVKEVHTTMEVELPAVENAGDAKIEESKMQIQITPFACFEESSIEEKSTGVDVIFSLDTMKPGELTEEEAVEDDPEEQDTEGVKDDEELNVLSSNVKGDKKEDLLGEDSQIANEECFINVQTEKYVGKVYLGEHGEEEIVEEDLQEPVEENEALEEEHRELSAMAKEPKIGKVDLGEHGEEKIEEENLQGPVEGNEAVEEERRELSAMPKERNIRKVDIGGEEVIEEEDHPEPVEENEALEEERRQLSAMAKERKIRKEHEIFVGGLDKDATEEDTRKVFETIGEIVEVRLHKNLPTNKNKGYAFVTFSSKENAKRALAEIKNPIIAGKRCRTAPSEDNNTLFLGNICNTWTKEAIKQKLKEYGVEGFEKITLVSDVQHEGLSRGFAFVEFFCHIDAMLAYKRLQKPDVIFGHAERTVKVAFAAPLQDPDPEVMAQVKSVFIDGIPPNLGEAQVRERLKGYGHIVRIFLARNMPTAKRKDFGFVDFSTHKDAVACVQGLNNTEFGDGNLKTKIKARLSNPLPKTQAVKGGMCGGFRIGHGNGGPFPKFGKSFERGGNSFNHPHFMRGRGFNQGGQVQRGRIGFQNNFEYENPCPEFNRRQDIGGRRGSIRGGHFSSVRGGAVAASSRPLLDGWRDPPGREYGFETPLRQQPYTSEAHHDRSYLRPHFDSQYNYIDNVHGTKRPYSMMEHGPDYREPGRVRQRFDYSNPVGPFQGNHYRDTYGSGSSSQFPNNIYGPDYGGGPRSSFYRGGHSFGRGYYY